MEFNRMEGFGEKSLDQGKLIWYSPSDTFNIQTTSASQCALLKVFLLPIFFFYCDAIYFFCQPCERLIKTNHALTSEPKKWIFIANSGLQWHLKSVKEHEINYFFKKHALFMYNNLGGLNKSRNSTDEYSKCYHHYIKNSMWVNHQFQHWIQKVTCRKFRWVQPAWFLKTHTGKWRLTK